MNETANNAAANLANYLAGYREGATDATLRTESLLGQVPRLAETEAKLAAVAKAAHETVGNQDAINRAIAKAESILGSRAFYDVMQPYRIAADDLSKSGASARYREVIEFIVSLVKSACTEAAGGK